jgi:uncharacterized membrane protein YfcA
MIRHSLFLTAALGVLAGALGGMMGVGGGIILVPLLVHLVRKAQHEAQGLSLIFVVATAAVAVIPYLREERIDWRLAAILTAGALPGVIVGARTARRIPALGLRRLFGVAVLLTGLRLLVAPPAVGATPAVWPWPADVTLGFGVGCLAGLLGVGGGTVLVPALVLAQGMPQHLAQGVSLLLIVPVGIVGAMTYAKGDALDTRLLPGLLVGGAVGGLLGGLGAQAISGPTLSRLFAVFLLAVSLQMILGRPRSRGDASPETISGGS